MLISSQLEGKYKTTSGMYETDDNDWNVTTGW